MQILLDKLGLGEGAGAIALWLGLGIILLIIVVSFGGWLLRTLRPSLNMGGQGRAGRPQRLAITDAFNLDREGRKLVIIRRDNVEHLLLIGGVNDIVIESNIIKGERAVRGRAAEGDASLLPEIPASGSEPQRLTDGARPQAPNGGAAPVAVAVPAPSITMPPPYNNGAPLAQVSNAPQLRVPAALATTPARPNAAPAPQDMRALEGMMTARRDVPLASPPPPQAMGMPQDGPNASGNTQAGNVQAGMRPAQGAPPPPSVKVEAQKPSSQPAGSFEDEFKRALASAPLPQGQKPSIAPQLPAGAKPPANPAPMPPPVSPKNAAAPSAPANPAQANPAPARQEPMSEMARRLNEVLQRPINNGGNAPTAPAPAPAAAPAAPSPQSLPAKKPADAPPHDQDMDMLEEEMAKLLGRVGPPPGRS